MAWYRDSFTFFFICLFALTLVKRCNLPTENIYVFDMTLITATDIFLYCTNQLVSLTKKQRASCEVRIELLNILHHWQNNPFRSLAFLWIFWQVWSSFHYFELCNSNFYRAKSSALRPTSQTEGPCPCINIPHWQGDQLYSQPPGSLLSPSAPRLAMT
jgi:hypothetical protein